MGNSYGEKTTLLELCRQLETLPANVHLNNNKEIAKLNDKISAKLSEYRTKNKFYSDDDFLEYETVILLTEKDNVFYKLDSLGISEIQYSLNSYLNSQIRHQHDIVFTMIGLLIKQELRLTAKFCYENKIKYQNFLLYRGDITKTKFYVMYPKILEMTKLHSYEIFSHYIKDSDTIEIFITNPSNNKRIKYHESKLLVGYVLNGKISSQFSIDFVYESLQ